MDPRMLVWKRPGAAGLVLVCVTAACGEEIFPPTPRDPIADEGAAVIELHDNLPSPGTLMAEVGEVVEWRNVGANEHSVSDYGNLNSSGVLITEPVWEDTSLEPGESFLHAFESPGEYSYICIHHGEIGSVVVSEASGDMGDMDMDDMGMDDMGTGDMDMYDMDMEP